MFPSRRAALGGDIFRDEYSVEFDGTNDYVDCGVTGLPVGNSARTMMAWVYQGTADGDDRGILGWGKSGGSGTNETFEFYNYDAGISIHYSDGSSDGSTPLGQNVWKHIVATFDGSTTSVYINGALDHTDSKTCATVGTHCRIGTDNYNSAGTGDNFNGKISDAAIYSSALSASQVATIYNGREPYNHKEGIASGTLVSWFRMGDGTERGAGTTIYDMSSNSNNGTMTNMEAADFVGDTP